MRFVPRLLATLGLSVVFVAALALGVVLHIDLPLGRRVTAQALGALLSSTFHGRISIGTLDRLTLRGVVARDVETYDVYGNNVLKLDEVRGKANLLGILREVLFGGDHLDIVIPHVRVEYADARIIADPKTGEPTIFYAFTPVARPAPAEPSRATKRQVRVWMPVIEVGHAYARGNVAGSPTLETQVAGARGSVLVTPEGAAVDIPRFGAVVRGLGGTDATGTAAVHVRAPGAIWWTFDGYFGNVAVGTFMRVDGKHMTITADIPRAKAKDLKAWLPGWPIQRDVSAHLELAGTPPTLQTTARFRIGESVLTARGPARLAGNAGLDLDVQGRNVDLRAVFPDAPETHIDVDTALNIWSKGGQVVVDANGTSQATRIADFDIPPADITGTYTPAEGFEGKATLHEHGMPTKVAFTIHPDGVIDLDARAPRFSIQGAPRLRPLTSARGELDVRVTGRIQKSTLDARVTADATNFALDDLRLQSAHLTGRARGPIAHPERLAIDAQLSGRSLAAGNFAFSRVTGSARGPVLTPVIKVSLADDYGPSIDAEGQLSARQGPRVENLELLVHRENVTLKGHVDSIDLKGGNVELRDLHMEGAGGTLNGWIRLRPQLFEAKLDGENLDLDAIAKALALPRGWVGGKLRINADVSAGRDVQRGRVFLALGNGTITHISGVSLRMNANLEDRELSGDVSGQIQDMGAFGATWDVTLGGHVSEPKSWRDVIGKAEIQLDRVELGNLIYLLPENLRIEEVRGQGFARLRVERSVPAALPSVYVDGFGTHGLEIIQAQAENSTVAPLHLKNYEINSTLGFDGETGETKLWAGIFHENDGLVTADANATFDLTRLVKAPSNFRRQLFETPLHALVTIPQHNLEQLPAELRPPLFTGFLRAHAALGGTLDQPVFGANIELKQLMSTDTRTNLPVDIQADARYEKASGNFTAQATMSQGARGVAAFTANGTARTQPTAAQGPAAQPLWTGDAKLLLTGLPLQLLPPLANSHVAGRLYGQIDLKRHAMLPKLRADVQVQDTTVDLVPIGTGRFTSQSDDKRLRTRLRFDSERGNLDASMVSALRWDGLAPKIDDSEPVQIDLVARAFDSVLLEPVLSGTLTKLQGRIDAKLAARLALVPDRDNPKEQRWSADIRGDASMQGGMLTMPALGLELRDLSLRANSTSNGRTTTIRIPDIRAKARSDRQNLQANAVLVLDGLRVQSGASNVAITHRMPFLVQGVTQAYVTGNASIQLRREPTTMLVNIDLSNLHAQLPRASGRSLVAINDNEQIEVVQPLREPTVAPDSEALPWLIEINLKRDVVLTRNDMTIPLLGNPELRIAKDVHIGGQIRLNDARHTGRVILFGKSFEIDQGEIDFDTGENDNPRVDITAKTRTPDGSIVYVDLYGTFKEAKFRFRSEPPTADPLRLLLAGPSATDAESETSGVAALAGAGAIGGAAFQELFGGTPLGSVVEFRTSASETTTKASYTAAVKISEKIWFEGTYRIRDLNQPTNTPNADRPDFSGTLDWRFRPRWSVRTEVGTIGAGVDLLWQYRY